MSRARAELACRALVAGLPTGGGRRCTRPGRVVVRLRSGEEVRLCRQHAGALLRRGLYVAGIGRALDHLDLDPARPLEVVA